MLIFIVRFYHTIGNDKLNNCEIVTLYAFSLPECKKKFITN